MRGWAQGNALPSGAVPFFASSRLLHRRSTVRMHSGTLGAQRSNPRHSSVSLSHISSALTSVALLGDVSTRWPPASRASRTSWRIRGRLPSCDWCSWHRSYVLVVTCSCILSSSALGLCFVYAYSVVSLCCHTCVVSAPAVDTSTSPLRLRTIAVTCPTLYVVRFYLSIAWPRATKNRAAAAPARSVQLKVNLSKLPCQLSPWAPS